MKLVLTIAAISKGQQRQQNLQQKPNELYKPNKKDTNVQVERQKIELGSSITFPIDEDDRNFPPNMNNNPVIQNVNLLQSVEPNLPEPAPTVELTRPTRVAIAAATMAAVTNRYSDDQLDYVRDFAWNMFQVGCEFDFFFVFN